MKFIIFPILLTIFSCRQPIAKTDNKKLILQECSPYFQYDHIEHYTIDIELSEITKLSQNKIMSNSETQLFRLLRADIPESLSDTSILKGIEKLGFKKTEISPTKFTRINEIFCERKHAESVDYACIADYRDIFVFKKANTIIGVTKICFGCNQNIIVGTQKNTEGFGQSGDYEKLDSLTN